MAEFFTRHLAFVTSSLDNSSGYDALFDELLVTWADSAELVPAAQTERDCQVF